MVETRQMEDMADPYMYPEDEYDPYLQDADILDRPDLFYGGKIQACGMGILPTGEQPGYSFMKLS